MLNQIRTVGQAYGRLQDQSQRMGVASSSALGFITEGLSAATAAALAFSVKFGSEVMESEKLSGNVFGNMARDIKTWSSALEKSSSLNEFEARRQAAIFFNLATSLKIPREEALKMSKNLVQLGVDLSSFHDVPIERAMQNIASGLIGNTRAMYGYGISLDQNTLKTNAYTTGIAAQGTELTKQQKVLSGYSEMLKQTEAAHGDFTRSFPYSAANQSRLMMQQLQKELALTGIAMQDLLFSALRMGRDILPYIRGMVDGFSKLPSSIQAAGIAAGVAAGPMMRFHMAMYQAQMSSGAFQGGVGKFMAQPKRVLQTAAVIGGAALGATFIKSRGDAQKEEQFEKTGVRTPYQDPKKIFTDAADEEVQRRQQLNIAFPGGNANPMLRVPESERSTAPAGLGEGELLDSNDFISEHYPDPAAGRLTGLPSTVSDLRGWRAEGGGTEKGKTYVVGEKGPELFIPKEDGTVVPNHFMGRIQQIIRKDPTLGDMSSDVFGARAEGGPVSRNRPVLVGESGPEAFIPDVPGLEKTLYGDYKRDDLTKGDKPRPAQDVNTMLWARDVVVSDPLPEGARVLPRLNPNSSQMPFYMKDPQLGHSQSQESGGKANASNAMLQARKENISEKDHTISPSLPIHEYMQRPNGLHVSQIQQEINQLKGGKPSILASSNRYLHAFLGKAINQTNNKEIAYPETYYTQLAKELDRSNIRSEDIPKYVDDNSLLRTEIKKRDKTLGKDDKTSLDALKTLDALTRSGLDPDNIIGALQIEEAKRASYNQASEGFNFNRDTSSNIGPMGSGAEYTYDPVAARIQEGTTKDRNSRVFSAGASGVKRDGKPILDAGEIRRRATLPLLDSMLNGKFNYTSADKSGNKWSLHHLNPVANFPGAEEDAWATKNMAIGSANAQNEVGARPLLNAQGEPVNQSVVDNEAKLTEIEARFRKSIFGKMAADRKLSKQFPEDIRGQGIYAHAAQAYVTAHEGVMPTFGREGWAEMGRMEPIMEALNSPEYAGNTKDKEIARRSQEMLRYIEEARSGEIQAESSVRTQRGSRGIERLFTNTTNDESIQGFGDMASRVARGVGRFTMDTALPGARGAYNFVQGRMAQRGASGDELDRIYRGEASPPEVTEQQRAEFNELRTRRDAGEELSGREQRTLGTLGRSVATADLGEAGQDVMRFTEQLRRATDSISDARSAVTTLTDELNNASPQRAANIAERARLAARNGEIDTRVTDIRAQIAAERALPTNQRTRGALAPLRNEARTLRAERTTNNTEITRLTGEYSSLPINPNAQAIADNIGGHQRDIERFTRQQDNSRRGIQRGEAAAARARASIETVDPRRTTPRLPGNLNNRQTDRGYRAMMGEYIGGEHGVAMNQLLGLENADRAGGNPVIERGMVVNHADGTMGPLHSGTRNSLSVNRSAALSSGIEFSQYHNHPSGTNISTADIGTLLNDSLQNPNARVAASVSNNGRNSTNIMGLSQEYANLSPQDRIATEARLRQHASNSYNGALVDQGVITQQQLDTLSSAEINTIAQALPDEAKRGVANRSMERLYGTAADGTEAQMEARRFTFQDELETDRRGRVTSRNTHRSRLINQAQGIGNTTDYAALRGYQSQGRTLLDRALPNLPNSRQFISGQTGGTLGGFANYHGSKGMDLGFMGSQLLGAGMRMNGADEESVRKAELVSNIGLSGAATATSAFQGSQGSIARSIDSRFNGAYSNLAARSPGIAGSFLENGTASRFNGGMEKWMGRTAGIGNVRFGAADAILGGATGITSYGQIRRGQDQTAAAEGREVTTGEKFQAGFGAAGAGGAVLGAGAAARTVGMRYGAGMGNAAGVVGITAAITGVQLTMQALSTSQRELTVQAKLQKATAQEQTQILADNLGASAEAAEESAATLGSGIGAIIGGLAGSLTGTPIGTMAGSMVGGVVGGAVGGMLADPISEFQTGKSTGELRDQSYQMNFMQSDINNRNAQRRKFTGEVAAGESAGTFGVGKFATELTSTSNELLTTRALLGAKGSLVENTDGSVNAIGSSSEIEANQIFTGIGGEATSIYGVENANDGMTTYRRDDAGNEVEQKEGARAAGDSVYMTRDKFNSLSDSEKKQYDNKGAGFWGTIKNMGRGLWSGDWEGGQDEERYEINQLSGKDLKARQDAVLGSTNRRASSTLNTNAKDGEAAEAERVKTQEAVRAAAEQKLATHLLSTGQSALGEADVQQSIIKDKGVDAWLSMYEADDEGEFNKSVGAMYPGATNALNAPGRDSIYNVSNAPFNSNSGPGKPARMPGRGSNPVNNATNWYPGASNMAPKVKTASSYNPGSYDVKVDVKVVPRNNESTKAANDQ